MRRLDITLTEEEFTTLTSIPNGLSHNDPDVAWIADMEALLAKLEQAAGPPRCASKNNGDYPSPCGSRESDPIHGPAEPGCHYPEEHHEFAP